LLLNTITLISFLFMIPRETRGINTGIGVSGSHGDGQPHAVLPNS
jgi:hypothetical protein